MKRKIWIFISAAAMAASMTACAGNTTQSNPTAAQETQRENKEMNMADKKSEEARPGKVTDADIYTLSSNIKQLYAGEEISIQGFLDGKQIGEIGKITADGKLTLDLPEKVADDLLTSREGTNVKGGTLTTKPEIHPWKSADDIMVLVYVNAPMGDYQTGWNYANMKHEMVPSTEGYTWIVMDSMAEN